MEAQREFLTTPEAAALLGLSHRTLETMRTRGGGPRFVKPGNRKCIRYRRDDLIAWAAGSAFASTSEYAAGRAVGK
jgi:excisionase family DNA binding protein